MPFGLFSVPTTQNLEGSDTDDFDLSSRSLMMCTFSRCWGRDYEGKMALENGGWVERIIRNGSLPTRIMSNRTVRQLFV